MQYRVYNRKTLKYIDGGAVASYDINDDYIVNNNSTIKVVPHKSAVDIIRETHTETPQNKDSRANKYYKTVFYSIIGVKTVKQVKVINTINGTCTVAAGGGGYSITFISDSPTAVTVSVYVEYELKSSLSKVSAGDIVALIQDSGAYHKGVITSVDDTANTILYRGDKELFNDNIINPALFKMKEFENEGVDVSLRFGVDMVIAVLSAAFKAPKDMYKMDGNKIDKRKRLPLIFVADGDVLDEEGNPKMLWTWSNDSINIVDWLTELFEKYNLSLSWDINFDISKDLTIEEKDGEYDPDARQPRYIVTLSAIVKSGGIVKDNVDMQTITYTVKEVPDATVCYVIDSDTKELLQISSGVNLLNPYTVTENKEIILLQEKNENGEIVRTFTQEQKSEDTNLSSYISFNWKTAYTFSEKSCDTKRRYVTAYDKNKKFVGWFDCKADAAITGAIASFTFNINSFNHIVNADDERTDEEIAEAVKFVRISYFNGATEVQFEKGDKRTEYDPFNKDAIFYLYEKDGEYSISTKIDDTTKERVLPIKTAVVAYNLSSDGTDETTPEDTAKDKLIPSQFNQAIEIRISSDSKMFDFANAKFGDQYQIINERGSVNSVFTGKKISSENKWVTLYFGLGKQNYTDLIQLKLRKQKYTTLYNQN